MVKCRKCGFEMPEDAAFCPNCGEPTSRTRRLYETREVKDLIRLGLFGTFLSLIIDSYASAGNINLYFIPPFLSALTIVYFSRTRDLKDALIVATTIYLLTNAIETGLLLGVLYAQGQRINISLTLADVIVYPISPITAMLAGYIGSKIAPRRTEIQSYITERERIHTLFHRVKGSLKKFKYDASGFYKS